jgi:hypothetical protein
MIEVVEILLKDSATMVLGAAIASFNEICPVRALGFACGAPRP